MLKRLITKLEDVEEPFRGLYEKTDDGFVLKTDDDDLKRKLDEFRTNNRELYRVRKDLEEQLAKYKDIDPSKYRELQERIGKLDGLEDAELLKAGKLDEVINKRTAAMRSDFETRFGAKESAYKQKEAEAAALRAELERHKIDGALRATIEERKLRVRAGAMEDVMRRARDTWRINDKGAMVPVGPDGSAVFGKEGNVLSMPEFVSDLATKASHLFEASGGGDSNGNAASPPTGKTIEATDRSAFRANLADIASGKLEVRTPR